MVNKLTREQYWHMYNTNERAKEALYVLQKIQREMEEFIIANHEEDPEKLREMSMLLSAGPFRDLKMGLWKHAEMLEGAGP